ncbi:MAG TPA: ABC transporter ATP-binding protein [Phycisphaerae bacterium]|nr:ABC transporter ATP-binding protein [Phycisphaerae bacterium]
MAEPVLELVDVRYRYPTGSEVLRGVTFSVAAGERVGLVGPNGAGKSTLLLAMAGFLAAGGRIGVAGHTLTRGTARDVRRHLGLVFQDADDQLFMPRVVDDVAFGPATMGLVPEEVASRVAEALSAVGLDGYEERAPYHLSVGEKRRAALATVLAMRPQILALDEPSASLDPRGRRRLIALLSGLSNTLLLIGHDLDMILEVCDRTVVMDAGRVVADGPSRQVLADRALLEAHGLELPLSLAARGGPREAAAGHPPSLAPGNVDSPRATG